MIDLHELRQAIINMTPRQNIYKVIKEELTKQEHWQNHARGNPKAGYRSMTINTAGINGASSDLDIKYE